VDGDAELLDGLRAGDEQAFVTLVARHHDVMLRLARSFVASPAIAEEVVQDAWLGILRGLPRYEGRGPLKAWMFQIVVNRARTTGVREHRSAPAADPERAVDAARFDATGHWTSPPQHWTDDVDDRLHADKMADRIRFALDDLPGRQRDVVTLRDIEGLTAHEVSDLLEISEGNQRVLLHRGRARLRRILEIEYGKV